MKEKIQQMKELMIKIVSNGSQILFIVIALLLGMYMGRSIEKSHTKPVVEEKIKIIPVEKLTEKTSNVYVDNKGEILIRNRSTGAYLLLSDSLGGMIYDHYASKRAYTFIKD